MHKLTGVSLSIGAVLAFCFTGQAQAGWSALAASSAGLEASLPVISIEDNKKHGEHKGKNRKAKNKKHKDNDDNEQANTNSGGKSEAEFYQDTVEKAEGRFGVGYDVVPPAQ